jgi:single-stranded DNA-binding protein
MNYVLFTVKVIKNSGQSFFSDGTSLTELTVQLPQVRKNNNKVILQVSIWGKLSYDVAKYYQPDDYIIIEGYISIRNIYTDRVINSLNKI